MLDVIPTGTPGRLRVVGEIDMSNAGTLAAILEGEQREARQLSLDLSEVSFIDSTGLLALLRMAGSHPVIILQPSDSVRRLLELAIPGGMPGLEIRRA